MKKLLSLLATTIVVTGATTSILTQNTSNIFGNKITKNIKGAATDLATIITVTNLGAITMAGNEPSKAEILTAIQIKNKTAADLTTSDFIFHDASTATSVTIVGVGNYSGQITVNYYKDNTRQDLNSVITIPNLGTFAMANVTPTKTELLTAIQAVNPKAAQLTTNDFILFDNTTANSVMIIGISNYSGKVFLQYQKQLTNIVTLIATTELGEIVFNGLLPTKAELLIAIQAINPSASELTVSDLQLEDTPTQDSATIIAVGNYLGTVKLTFSQKDTRVDIGSIISTVDLGTISTGGIAPTKAQILTAIQAVNPNAANLTTADFGFNENPTTTGVTIYGIGNNFKGQIALTYTVS